jgi:beta-lactamase superfamily II metal-dependent hydrolase
MPRTAIRLEVLPAAHGDCLLIECPVGKRTWRMLVDTGPDETYPALRTRLAAITPNAAGRRHVDLFVVTHIDHDHIGGAGRLLTDRTLKLDFGDVWFNAPGQRRIRGVKEGQELAELLGAPGVALPWNRAFGGGHAVTPEGKFLEVDTGRGSPRLTLLSPTPERLTRLFKVWDREVAKMAKAQELKLPKPLPRAAFAPDLTGLAETKTAKDRSVANGSSIALLLEHRGASVLLAADAFEPVLTTALRAVAQDRGASLPLQLDALKLSHHGSQANVTTELFGCVQARHHVVSTNGAIFGHPDDTAIARTILHGGSNHSLWFNYGNERNRRWSGEPLQARYGYGAHYPAERAAGVTMALKAAT